MRASRLVSLLLLLQTRGRMTGAELAQDLEVSVRTVYRDVEALSEAGVPIYAERGPHGGVRLVDGYRTRLTGLTQTEAEALFLSGLPGPAAELGLGTVVAAARLKVLAALPPELRSRASRITQRFHLDAPGWFHAPEELAHLERIAAAVWADRRITIRYDRGERTVDRIVDPLGLVLKAGVWYVVALAGDQTRTYRVSRIREVTHTDEHFERPSDFDLAGFWTTSTAAYERDAPTLACTVRIAPDRLGVLEDAVGERTVRTATRVDRPDPEGWLQLRLVVQWPDEAAENLLKLGPSIEVLEPPELRARMTEAARAVLTLYGAESPPLAEV